MALAYEQIKNKLEGLLNQGVISERTKFTIIGMSDKVLKKVLRALFLYDVRDIYD